MTGDQQIRETQRGPVALVLAAEGTQPPSELMVVVLGLSMFLITLGAGLLALGTRLERRPTMLSRLKR